MKLEFTVTRGSGTCCACQVAISDELFCKTQIGNVRFEVCLGCHLGIVAVQHQAISNAMAQGRSGLVIPGGPALVPMRKEG